jgi:YVTN family beta-propeller protein
MKIADFSMPENAPTADVSQPDFVVLGSVAVAHGAIADIATDGSTVAATNYGDNSVSVIDAETLVVDATIPVAGEPFAAAAADQRAYVSTASASCDSVSVIDTAAKVVVSTHPLAFSVTGVAVSPDGKRAFAARTGRDSVDLAVIDTVSDRVGTIDIATGSGITADALRVSPDGLRIYVATSDAWGGSLVVVDAETARVVSMVAIGSPIRDVALSADGGVAYVLSHDLVSGAVVDTVDTTTNEIASTVVLGGSGTQIALSPGTTAYVVGQDHVAVLCTITNEVVDTISVGAQPSCMAVSPDGGRLYVADYAGVVTAFSVASDVSLLQTDVIPVGIAASPEVLELEAAS